MSDYDVSPSEMKRLSNISDCDLDAMRVGHMPHDDSSMGGLTRFVRDLGEAFPEPSTADLEGVHVAAMLQAAHLMADNGEPVARPASKANGPENQASWLPKPWRETIMLRIKSVFATKAAKVTAVTMAMLLAMSGVAIAGVLPASIQDPVADAVQTVGIDLPGGADEIDGDNGQGGENIDEGDVNQIEEEDVTDVEGVDQSDDQGAQDIDESDAGTADQGDQDDDEQSGVQSSDASNDNDAVDNDAVDNDAVDDDAADNDAADNDSDSADNDDDDTIDSGSASDSNNGDIDDADSGVDAGSDGAND